MSETENPAAGEQPAAEEKQAAVDYGANVGDAVEYSLPEGTTIGGNSTFDAEIIVLHPDGRADLKFLPVGAESEAVVHEGVPNGPGSGQWLAYPLDDKSEHPGDTI